jgi:hypothetical protein
MCIPAHYAVTMRGLLPFLFGQTPSPENHAKLLFATGIPSGLRSAYYLYQNIEALYIFPHILVPFSCGTKSQLVSFSLDLKNCIHFSVQFTGTGQGCYLSSRFHLKLISGI